MASLVREHSACTGIAVSLLLAALLCLLCTGAGMAFAGQEPDGSGPGSGAFDSSGVADDGAQTLEDAKALIAALKADPDEVTLADRADIEKAQAAYDALGDAGRATLDAEVLSKNQTYGRWLEAAVWALRMLEPIDNATMLVDGDYSDLVASSCNMGKSTSARSREWKVVQLSVRGGRIGAVLRCDGASAFRTMHVGGVEYTATVTGGVPEFEVPFKVNEKLYLTTDANDIADSIIYEIEASVELVAATTADISAANKAAREAKSSVAEGSDAAVAADALQAAARKPGVTAAELKAAQRVLDDAMAATSSAGGGGKKDTGDGGEKGTPGKPAAPQPGASGRSGNEKPALPKRPSSSGTGASGSAHAGYPSSAGNASDSRTYSGDDDGGVQDADDADDDADAVSGEGADDDDDEGPVAPSDSDGGEDPPLAGQQADTARMAREAAAPSAGNALANAFVVLVAASLFLLGMVARVKLFVRAL